MHFCFAKQNSIATRKPYSWFCSKCTGELKVVRSCLLTFWRISLDVSNVGCFILAKATFFFHCFLFIILFALMSSPRDCRWHPTHQIHSFSVYSSCIMPKCVCVCVWPVLTGLSELMIFRFQHVAARATQPLSSDWFLFTACFQFGRRLLIFLRVFSSMILVLILSCLLLLRLLFLFLLLLFALFLSVWSVRVFFISSDWVISLQSKRRCVVRQWRQKDWRRTALILLIYSLFSFTFRSLFTTSPQTHTHNIFSEQHVLHVDKVFALFRNFIER